MKNYKMQKKIMDFTLLLGLLALFGVGLTKVVTQPQFDLYKQKIEFKIEKMQERNKEVLCTALNHSLDYLRAEKIKYNSYNAIHVESEYHGPLAVADMATNALQTINNKLSDLERKIEKEEC